MAEEKQNVIKFEMPKYYKFLFYQLCIIGQWIIAIVFIDVLSKTIKAKQSLTYILTGPVLFFGLIILLCLIGMWKVRHMRLASELTVDKENKEFCAYIYDVKKEVKFGCNDIKEVKVYPDILRFYLKDGTWVSWAKEKSSGQILGDIIQSFGTPIKT